MATHNNIGIMRFFINPFPFGYETMCLRGDAATNDGDYMEMRGWSEVFKNSNKSKLRSPY